MTQNPYTPTCVESVLAPKQASSLRRWATIGFLAICIPVAALGGYALYADARYSATLPPNAPRCGNGAMSAMLLIFPGAPIIGLFGAGIGVASALVFDAATCYIRSERDSQDIS